VEIRTSSDFVDSLGLKGEAYAGVSLEGILLRVWDFASKIWDKPRLYRFVDHGLQHSCGVLAHAQRVLRHLCPQGFGLSGIERLVLGVAALIHDIGMQYPKYEKQGAALDASSVRRQHTRLGYEMLQDAMSGDLGKRGGPELACSDQEAMFLHLGAMVGFAHSGPEFWGQLKEPHYRQTFEGGQQLLRIRFLAAVFRLADELHTEYTRLTEPDYIGSSQLDERDKCHWMACNYVRAIRFESPGAGSLSMYIEWRIPEGAKDEDVDLIRALLVELRETKIRQEIQYVRPYLKADESMAFCVLEFELEPDPQPSPAVHSLPEQVVAYIRNNLRPYQFGVRVEPKRARVVELPDKPQLDKLKSLARDFILSGEGAISGHFRLKTKWHTNKYIRCRELCANLEFVRGLCMCLSEHYGEDNFTHILGVGTSALRIASQLSFQTRAHLSYTFVAPETVAGQSTAKDYTEQERNVTLPKGARLLIVDDILGVGSVLHTLVGYLKDRYSLEYARAFAIYSLGHEKDLLAQLGDEIKVDYLVAFPDVIYRPELPGSEACDLCRGDSTISRTEE
jgi:orotate phosphoribosyltransferase